MFFFSCPACSSRISMCCGKAAPIISHCPECKITLAFIREQRTLLDKIRDSWTPIDLISAVNDA